MKIEASFIPTPSNLHFFCVSSVSEKCWCHQARVQGYMDAWNRLECSYARTICVTGVSYTNATNCRTTCSCTELTKFMLFTSNPQIRKRTFSQSCSRSLTNGHSTYMHGHHWMCTTSFTNSSCPLPWSSRLVSSQGIRWWFSHAWSASP